MRQKFRKAVAALSRGQLFRIDQTVAFDFVEPDYDPELIGACCTDSDGDGRFCDCESNVTARDCCLQKGIHSPGLTCDGEAGGVVVCCEPEPGFVGCCIPGQEQCVTLRADLCAQLGGNSNPGGCSGVVCGCNGVWCCDDGNSIRTCTEANQFDPPDGGYGICNFQGCDTVCEGFDCGFTPETGACCSKCGEGTDNPDNLNGSCSQSTAEECAALGGQFNGVGSECDYYACGPGDDCNDPENSCCAHNPDTGLIECTQVDAFECAAKGGIFTEGGNCDNDPCAGLLQICCCTGVNFSLLNCPPIDVNGDGIPEIPQICVYDFQAQALVYDPSEGDPPETCKQGGAAPPTQELDCSCGGDLVYTAGSACFQYFEPATQQCFQNCGDPTGTICANSNGVNACQANPDLICPGPQE